MDKRLICRCFLSRNIFLKKYNIHVTYENDQQFEFQYGKVLHQLGFKSKDFPIVKNEILQEIDRRKNNGVISQERKAQIKQYYSPLHNDLYILKESFFHEKFIELVKYARQSNVSKEDLMSKLDMVPALQVYSFPVFTEEFCEKIIEELKHFENSDMPKGRPNSMNTTGILLEELGFYPNFIDILRRDYILPIASLLYPEWVGDSKLDSQRAFVVSYDYEKMLEESDLRLHFDNAEVTLNIALNKDFQGGELYFGKMKSETDDGKFSQVNHRKGHGILHRGYHFHGAMPLEEGERYNLIIWMRSSSIRNKICPMCEKTPELTVTAGDHDGFTIPDVELCSFM